MDLYSVVLTVHIISFVWNIFFVVLSDITGLLWVTGKKALAPGRFLRLTHRLIFVGLAVSVVSGLYLFSTVSDYLLTVPAFYTKMLLVLALVINGFFIGKHIAVAEQTPFVELGNGERNKLIFSGVISTVAWIGVFISANLLGL